MNLLSSISALGVWPALPLTGYLLFPRRHLGSDTHSIPKGTSFALMTVAGIAVWSVFLLAAAMAGIYRADCFGLAGWIVILFTLTRRFKRQDCFSPIRARLSIWDWVFLAGLVLTAWLYLAFPTESIIFGRDEGVYANHGIYIAHHGRLDIPYPWPKSLDAIFSKGFLPITGIFATKPTMTVQFAHLFPVWLAQAFSTFGHHTLFRLNAVFALLFIVIFYGFCQSAMPKPYAVIATLFLALNPSEIWLARRPLTEIPTQLLIWSGLLLLLLAQKGNNRQTARWAGLILGFSSLVRIDSFVFVPLLFLSHWMQKMVEPPGNDKSSSVWSPFYQTALPIFALALVYYALDCKIYFLTLFPLLKQLGIIALATLFVLLASTQASLKFVKSFFTGRATLVLIGIILAALVSYAYWLRPGTEPYSIINNPEHFLHGTRDYRENSLVNLAKYLSPPVIFVCFWGWFITLWTVIRKKKSSHLIVVMVCFAGFSALYLINPSIAPDHFWAIRRFVPMVIPGVVFFSGLGIRWILEHLPRRGAIVVSGTAILFLLLFTAGADRLIITFAENKGNFAQFENFAGKLPKESVILAHANYPWIAPLYVAFDCPVVPLDFNIRHGAFALYRWVGNQKSKQKPAYIILGEHINLTGLSLKKIDEVILSRSYAEETPNPLPKKIASQQVKMALYSITEMDQTFYNGLTDDTKLLTTIASHLLDQDLGKERVLGTTESGFYGQEFLDNSPVRWTSGTAKIHVRLDKSRLPRAMSLDILSAGGVKEKRVRILANGHELFDGKIPDGGYSQLFNLSDVPMKDLLNIEIISDTHRPSEMMKGSLDNRPLGVLVRGIKLSDRVPDYININLGNEKVLGVDESGFHGQESLDKMPFRWTDGSARLVVPIDKKRLPNAMHVEIDSPGKRVRILANGHELFNGLISDGGYSQLFRLSGVPLGRELTIKLLSDTHIPIETLPGATDNRSLGVLVKSIRLLDNDYININLGNEKVLGVDESGFYGQEFLDKMPVRWTDGAARLVVPIDKKRLPNAMHVEIDSPGKRVRILANGHELFKGQMPDGGYSQLFRLSDVPLGKELTIRLLSDTHIPKETLPGATDNRSLGVLVKSIRLLDKDYINVNLGSERVLGVDESGFHGQEFLDKVSFRWTDGNARLIVSIDKKRLPVSMDVNIDSPGKRVRILANGHELFNGQVPDGGYSQRLSLSRVPLRKQLTIELLSDVHIPKKTIKGSTDDRFLGVLVKSIRLLAKDQP